MSLTPEVIDAYIKNIEAERSWITHGIWPDRVGESWHPSHGPTSSFKKPGKLRTEGAISALKYVKKILERGP